MSTHHVLEVYETQFLPVTGVIRGPCQMRARLTCRIGEGVTAREIFGALGGQSSPFQIEGGVISLRRGWPGLGIRVSPPGTTDLESGVELLQVSSRMITPRTLEKYNLLVLIPTSAPPEQICMPTPSVPSSSLGPPPKRSLTPALALLSIVACLGALIFSS